MSLQETVEFAQAHFGDNRGVPNLPDVRPRVPPWLEEGLEAAVPIAEGDRPVIEGDPAGASAEEGPANGASIDELYAYYLPFHFYRKGWGSYIRAYGIERLTRLLAPPVPDDVPDDAPVITSSSVLFAFRLLLEHERLHFLAELAASRLEVASGLSSYGRYFADRRAATHEEALANAQAFTSAKRRVAIPLVQVAHSWMSNQPAGYRDFHKWLGFNLPLGQRAAAAYMTHPVRAPGSVPPDAQPPGWPGEFLFEESRKLHPPTYLIVDRPVAWLRIVRPFPKLLGLQVHVHTNDHKPPHIHIQVLKRRHETRYKWPALRPLQGDPSLSKSDRRSLSAYVDAWHDEIDAKVKSVPWT